MVGNWISFWGLNLSFSPILSLDRSLQFCSGLRNFLEVIDLLGLLRTLQFWPLRWIHIYQHVLGVNRRVCLIFLKAYHPNRLESYGASRFARRALNFWILWKWSQTISIRLSPVGFIYVRVNAMVWYGRAFLDEGQFAFLAERNIRLTRSRETFFPCMSLLGKNFSAKIGKGTCPTIRIGTREKNARCPNSDRDPVILSNFFAI